MFWGSPSRLTVEFERLSAVLRKYLACLGVPFVVLGCVGVCLGGALSFRVEGLGLAADAGIVLNLGMRVSHWMRVSGFWLALGCERKRNFS